MDTHKYIEQLVLKAFEAPQETIRQRAIIEGVAEGVAAAAPPAVPDPSTPAVVNGGSLISFVSGVSAQEMRDVLYSVQLAQRGASGAFNRFDQTRQWYDKYSEILSQVGWVGEQLVFKEYSQGSGHLEIDQAALEVIAAIATGQQLTILTKSLDALRKLAAGDRPITLFEYNALAQASGNFQMGAVQKGPGADGPLSMGLGGFYFHAEKQQGKFLFFSWGGKSAQFWAAVQKLTLNVTLYAQHRDLVESKLGVQSAAYLNGLTLSP
jgi:hypothetical protein